jgi:hypothetical protein
MSFRFPLSLLFIFAISLKAQVASPGEPPSSSDSQTVKLEAYVVTDSLDVSRDSIVPSLGATSYDIGKMQLDSESLGGNGTFNEILLRVPSVAQDSYGQVHLRGEHANLQYRINDVLLPEGISGFGQELDIPFMKSAAILTGSLPAQYGYRTAGVVDIHTQNTEKGFEGTLGAFIGSHNTVRVSTTAGGNNGKLSGFTTVSTETNNLGIESPTPSKEAIHDKTNQIKIFTNLTYLIDSLSRISLMLSNSTSTFQIPNSPGLSQNFILNGVKNFNSSFLNENQSEFNDYAILSYQKTSGDFAFQVSAFTRYSLTHYVPDFSGDLIFNGVASNVHQDLISNGLEFEGKWDISTNHTVRFGNILTTNNANTKTNTAVFSADSEGNQLGTIPFWIQDSHHRLGWLVGLYLQDEWKLPSNIKVNFGLRSDNSKEQISEYQLSPRLNIVWQITPNTNMHLGFSHYFTPPPIELVDTPSLNKFTNTTNTSLVSKNSVVQSEKSNYFDYGFTQTLTSTLSFNFDSYFKKATNLLDQGQFGQAVVFAAYNYKYGEIYGAEISLNYTTKKTSAYINTAVGRAYGKFISSGQFEFDKDILDYASTHSVALDHEQKLTLSSGLSYHFTSDMIYLDLLYGSGLRSGFANTLHQSPYYPVNLGYQHTSNLKFKRKLTTRLDIVNCFDQIYALHDVSGIGVFAPQYGARRGVFVSTSLSF